MTQSRNWLSGVLLGISLSIVLASMWFAYMASEDRAHQTVRTQMLRDLISTTDHGLIVLSPEGQIVEWGPGATAMFGWREDEVLGSSIDFLFPEQTREAVNKVFKTWPVASQLRRSLVHIDGWAFDKKGELKSFHSVSTRFKNHVGYYTIILFTDIGAMHSVIMLEKPTDAVPTKPEPRPVDRRPAAMHPDVDIKDS